MPKFGPETFLVKSPGRSMFNRSPTKYVWFQLCDTGDVDEGKRLRIPVVSYYYDDESVIETLSNVEEGDYVEATLQREDSEHPWRPTECEILYQ
jgi:hypothetical protein